MSSSLDPDQARRFVRPDLGQKCFHSYQQTTLGERDKEFGSALNWLNPGRQENVLIAKVLPRT